MPQTLPGFPLATIQSWKNLPYAQLALNIISPFVGDTIPQAQLKKLVEDAYSTFDTANVTNIKELEKNLYVLELFHGPTLAFKDVALQLLGRLQNHILQQNNENIVIIGATSGDTGSAAIEGVKSCERIQLFMLHPKGRTSDIQRRQMTTVQSPNIHNIAVEGSFDDCQDAVKEMFREPAFMKGKKLSAVNSINWARIMAQIVYYFHAALQVNGATAPVSFSVPSGNFGDILAGYLAKQMGLPVEKLIVATNTNDILHRFVADNNYSKNGVVPTHAPSMDIQISSNFERMLYLEHGRDGAAISQLMNGFAKNGKLSVAPDVHASIKSLFQSLPSSDAQISAEIERIYKKYNYLVCPHTATGTRAAQALRNAQTPMIALATAAPAKFPDVVQSATGVHPALPSHLSGLMQRPEKYEIMPNNIDSLKNYIYSHSI